MKIKNPIYNKSINQVNKISIIFAALLTVIFTLVIIYNTYQEYKEEIKLIEANYYKSQKEFIKNETKRAIKFIEFKYQKYVNKKDLKVLQSDIVDAIEHMRNERDGSGYIFIYTFDGINIADPILKENAGKNLLNFQDVNGKKVIAELIDVSKQEDGGFVEYVWNKPTTNKTAPKISYAKSFAPWNWMVGSGVYLDDIEVVLQQKKEEYQQKVIKYTLQILSLAFMLFLSGMAIYRFFTMKITKNIEYIKSALANHELIEYKNLNFDEFMKIGKFINIMNSELQDLNKNLEKKVEERTKELQESREYAEKLVIAQDKFIKNAIHEINTPLSIIITNIDLSKMKLGENRYLSKIEAGSKIIHNIYNDLSYMVKKDRVEYKKTDIDFSSFLKQRIDFFHEVAIGNNLKIVTEIEDKIIINFNDTELQRICDNNISNAIKYSFENSTIEIKLIKNDNSVIFQITNNGDDIKDLQLIFDRYYREDDSSGGFGIGLNMIKEICDKNDVKIEATSANNIITFRYTF